MELFLGQDAFALEKDLVVQCPHCAHFILISKINCQIFRHGVYKLNGEQIPPHMSQIECEQLVAADSIYGCGRPFRIVKNEQNENSAIICGYI